MSQKIFKFFEDLLSRDQ